jgi:hypothetical protein
VKLLNIISAHRRQAVQEMVDSEQEYCNQLWTLVNAFQVPLQVTNMFTPFSM